MSDLVENPKDRFSHNEDHLCSLQSHSSVERAGLIAAVKMRKLETDENYALRGLTLQHAIDEDRAKGLVPIFVRHCSFLPLYKK